MDENTNRLLSLLVAGQVLQLAGSIQARSASQIAQGKGVKPWAECEADAITQLSDLADRLIKTR